jgi:hypothetical protein
MSREDYEALPPFAPLRVKLFARGGGETPNADAAELRRATQTVKQHLDQSGFAVVDFVSLFDTLSQLSAAEIVTDFVTAFGSPLRVFGEESGLWREVGVDLARPPDRSRGSGHLPLHMDFVNAERPPDLVCLLCVRPDPLGGGASLVAPIHGIEEALTQQDVAALSCPVFRDGEVRNLTGVGHDINPFAVISDDTSFRYRYTGHLLKTRMANAFSHALKAAARVLERRVVTVPLREGNLLIMDQHRVVHGRFPVGQGQNALPPEQRRLMLLSFLRTGDRR